MKHIVFICQVFHPDNTATSQLFGDLLARLAVSTSITVLSGYPTRRDHQGRSPAREVWNGIEIVRCGLDVDAKRSYWVRFAAYFSFLAVMSVELFRIRGKDVVLGVTNPPFLVIVLWLLSHLDGFRYQYMFLDVYPDGLVALNKLDDSSWIARLWRACNKPSLQGAEKLIVLGRDMRALLAQQYSMPASKFVYLPHWSSTAISQPLDFAANPVAAELCLQGKFVVQYSGNMGLWHDINTIVQAASMLQARSEIQFLMIGNGIRRNEAMELAQQLQLKNITWLDFFPKDCLAESLTCCHAALVSLRAGLEGIAVPSKLYGILASGRAVLAQVPANSEIAYVVKEERCGLVLEPGSAQDLAQAIRTLADRPNTAIAMGRSAFAAYRDKYTLEQAVEHFRALWADEPVPQPVSHTPVLSTR